MGERGRLREFYDEVTINAGSGNACCRIAALRVARLLRAGHVSGRPQRARRTPERAKEP
jgi:hypothetical protein